MLFAFVNKKSEKGSLGAPANSGATKYMIGNSFLGKPTTEPIISTLHRGAFLCITKQLFV